jgi:uncharacterized protein involved in exopolysaccharide biosynthesis
MDLLSIVQALWRHKIFVIPVIVFTAAGSFYVVKLKSATYEASSSVLLANPPGAATPSQISDNPDLKKVSPYNTFVSYGDLSVVADSVIELLTSAPAQPALIQSGVDPRYQVTLSTAYGNPPIIDITGVGSTPQVAVQSANLLAAAVKTDLYQLQESQGINNFYMITALEIVKPVQAQRSTSGKLRSLIAVIGLGALLLFVVVSVAEAVAQRRRGSSASAVPRANDDDTLVMSREAIRAEGSTSRDLVRSSLVRSGQGASAKAVANGSGSTSSRLRQARLRRPGRKAGQ